MKTKLFLGMLTAAAGLAVAPAVFADNPEVNYNYTIEANSTKTTTGETLEGYNGFSGIGITVSGTVTGFTLEGSGQGTITDTNVYFTGYGQEGADSITITSMNIGSSTASTGTVSTLKSFIVEGCTVIIDGGADGFNIAELGLNLCIGTMEDATLSITNGAHISTGAYWSTVGSNGATGTIEISGEGSQLDTQQINIGMSVSSLSGGATTTDGEYFAQYLESDEERNAVISAILSGSATGEGYSGSYGIVNVTNGGKWTVGMNNEGTSTGDSYQSKLQLANGEINITGGELVLGQGSGLVLMGESSIVDPDDGYSKVAEGVMLTEKITVTEGGKVSSTGTGVFEVVLGDSWFASNSTVEVLVSGNDSSFDVTANTKYSSDYIGIYIGTNSGYWDGGLGAQTPDGGTVDVDISATDGGVFKVSTLGGIYVAADNYNDYLTSNPKDAAGHSYGLTVAFNAESGGSLTLEAVRDDSNRSSSTSNMDGVIYLGVGSAAEDYQNTITATATGENSELVFSAYTIYTNYQSGNLATSFVATDGGSLTIKAERQIAFGFESSGDSNNSVEVKADGGTVLITGADDVYTNYGSGDLTSKFGAYNGGTLTIEASNEIVFGVGGTDPQRTGTTLSTDGGSATVTANGKSEENETASSVVISTKNFFVNYNTTGNFDSSFVAENGGSIEITASNSSTAPLGSEASVYIGYTPNGDLETSAASGTSSFTATGTGSTISISAKTEVLVNYNASSEFLASFAAENGGTIYIQTTDTTNGRIYLGDSELSETAGGKISISADGAGSTVGIYAPVEVYVNWDTSGSDIVAKNGGSISITASTTSPFAATPTTTNVWLGYGEKSTGELNVTATGKDDDGTASSIAIASGTQIVVNSGTGKDFTSNFTAADGGSLSMSSSYIYFGSAKASGELNVLATGENSVVSITASNDIYTNYGAGGDIAVSFTAEKGGTLELSGGQYMYLYKGTEIVANNGTVNISVPELTGYIQLFEGASISAKNNSKLTTSDIGVFSGASVTIDGTSTWTGGWTDLYAGSSVSITTSASAITILDDAASANVNLGEVYIESTASITVVIDISSIDNYTEASVAVLTAESIIFDANIDWYSGTELITGTTLSDSDYSDTLDSFIKGYVICEQNGFDLNYWSYVANGDGTYTLYANIRTLPEPSMFGLLFGLSALGLVSTRRRRRKA